MTKEDLDKHSLKEARFCEHFLKIKEGNNFKRKCFLGDDLTSIQEKCSEEWSNGNRCDRFPDLQELEDKYCVSNQKKIHFLDHIKCS